MCMFVVSWCCHTLFVLRMRHSLLYFALLLLQLVLCTVSHPATERLYCGRDHRISYTQKQLR
jgi:hypothetical protein